MGNIKHTALKQTAPVIFSLFQPEIALLNHFCLVLIFTFSLYVYLGRLEIEHFLADKQNNWFVYIKVYWKYISKFF